MLHITISPSVVPVSSSGRPGPGEDADSRCSGAAAEAAGAAATTVTRAAFPHTAHSATRAATRLLQLCGAHRGDSLTYPVV